MAELKFLDSTGLTALWEKIKNTFVASSTKGVAGGVASLDNSGKVPSAQLPTYPTVNDGNLLLQADGTTKVTFTANQSGDSTFDIAQGSSNGTISVGGTDVSVKGLQAMAYKASLTESDIPALSISKITNLQTSLNNKVETSLLGANSGVATLDSGGKVPSSQLPSYVDDVLEYLSKANFPLAGETGKIYVALDTNLTYRWGGTAYVEISPSLALGITSDTAYYGDKGKIAYDHSQSTHARTDATAVTVDGNTPNGSIKINGTTTTVYTHPTDAGNKHIPSGGSTNQFLKYSASGTAVWADNPVLALDVNDISGFGAGKTLATLTETDGKIAATFQNISITHSQISDYPTTIGSHSLPVYFNNGTPTVIDSLSVSGDIISTGGGVVAYGIADLSMSSSGGGTGTVIGVAVNGTTYEPDNGIVTLPDYVQSDWNQTTTTALDYIKNKPTLGDAAYKDTGTTSGTVAAGDHTHQFSFSGTSGAANVTLSAGTKYQVKAGGSELIIRTPNDTWRDITDIYNPNGTASSSISLSQKGAQDMLSFIGQNVLTDIAWSSNKLTKTINGTTSDVVSISTIKTALALTKSDVGLGNVGNFKAVSTEANQGLTSTEQSNARANIGAGTSSLTLGSSHTTAAYGDHTHTGFSDGLSVGYNESTPSPEGYIPFWVQNNNDYTRGSYIGFTDDSHAMGIIGFASNDTPQIGFPDGQGGYNKYTIITSNNIGSQSVSYATSAGKLSNTSAIGSLTKPVYFTSSGVPAACTYSLEKSVPSDALFTDTWKAASTSQEGYAPKLELAATTTIATQSLEYVLTYKDGTNTTPVWRKLPTNAFLNTQYSAGTGLSLSGTTFNHSNSVTAQNTQAVYPIKIDAQGHISAYGSAVSFGTAAGYNATDSVTSGSDNLVTSGAVYSAIAALPTPMQFKGGVGTNTTITWDALPSASSSNNGWAYKVITEHSTQPICKVGDMIISNGVNWVVIPSGDEPSGTVTSIATGAGLTGGTITSSGTISIDSTYQTYISHGESAYNSLSSYLPKSGGTVGNGQDSTPLTIYGKAAEGSILKFACPYSGAPGQYESLFGIDWAGNFLVMPSGSSTAYNLLHSGNSSVSKNGSTLTVTINGTSESLTDTDTWRPIADNLTSSTATTTSLSAKQGYLLANGSARDDTKLPLSAGASYPLTGVLSFNGKGFIESGRSTSYNYGYALWSSGNDLANSIGIYSGPDSSEEGGMVISPDMCFVFNSADSGWNFAVFDKDLGSDLSTTTSMTFGIDQSTHSVWSLGGFKKNGSDDTYVLTGGGGHASISGLSVNYANSASSANSAGNADTLDSYHATSFFRYEGWWSDSSLNVDNASGMVFAYNTHGVPGTWGTVATFEYQRGSDYKLQLFGDGWNNVLYYRNRSADRSGWMSWRTLIDDSNWGSYIGTSSNYVGYATYATSAGSAPASDVSDWAKRSSLEMNLAASSVPSYIQLSAATQYCLSAGGSSIYFCTPQDTNTWRPLGTGASDACAGNDSRLSDARRASDVYDWAKASSKPSYAFSEITGTVTNAQLAGSIANNKLAHYTITISGEDVDLGGEISQSSLRNALGLGSAAYTASSAYATAGHTHSQYSLTSHTHQEFGNGTNKAPLSIWGKSGDGAFLRFDIPNEGVLGYIGFDTTYGPVLLGSDASSYVTLIHSGNIGEQSVGYADSAGSVAWGNVSGRPTNVSSFTNDSGYVTSSGVTSVATGTGLTGGTITGTGTISINSTYQTYISHGESAYNSLSSYLPLSGGTITGALKIQTNQVATGSIPLTLTGQASSSYDPGCLIYLIEPYRTTGGQYESYLGTIGGNLVFAQGSTAYDVLHTGNKDSYTYSPASHTHGNIQNGGTLQSSDIAIASGDKLVVTDSSDSSKIARTSLSFDGSTITKALTKKGTFEDVQLALVGGSATSVGTTIGINFTGKPRVDIVSSGSSEATGSLYITTAPANTTIWGVWQYVCLYGFNGVHTPSTSTGWTIWPGNNVDIYPTSQSNDYFVMRYMFVKMNINNVETNVMIVEVGCGMYVD